MLIFRNHASTGGYPPNNQFPGMYRDRKVQLPPGYGQDAPPSGPPRPFRITEPLRIEARMISRSEIRTGTASSPDGIRIFDYKSDNRAEKGIRTK